MCHVRHAVCASLVFTVLLCCTFVSVTVVAAATSVQKGVTMQPVNLPSVTTEVALPVDVSCADDDNKLQWRFYGTSQWNKCATAVGGLDYTYEVADGDDGADVDDILVFDSLDTVSTSDTDVSTLVCLPAESLYTIVKCNESCGAKTGNDVAFTMHFTTLSNSAVHRKWKTEKGQDGQSPQFPADSTQLGKEGVCPLTITNKGASTVDGGTPNASPREEAPPMLSSPQTALGTSVSRQPGDESENSKGAKTTEAQDGAQDQNERTDSTQPTQPEERPSSTSPESAPSPVATGESKPKGKSTHKKQTEAGVPADTTQTPSALPNTSATEQAPPHKRRTETSDTDHTKNDTAVNNTTSVAATEPRSTNSTTKPLDGNADGVFIITVWGHIPSMVLLMIMTAFASGSLCTDKKGKTK